MTDRAIEHFLEEKSPKFWSFVRACGMDTMIKNLAASAIGVNVFIPTDAGMSKLFNSAREPCDILLPYIVKAGAKSAADWESRVVRFDLEGQQLFATKGKDKDSVDISYSPGGPAEFSIAPVWADRMKIRTAAVWQITNGAPSSDASRVKTTAERRSLISKTRAEAPNAAGRDADAAEAPSKKRAGKGARRGGLEDDDIYGGYAAPSEPSLRFKIALAIEQECLSYAMRANNSRSLPPHIDAVWHFVRFLQTNDREILYERVLPLISFRNTDFYAIFEPHSGDGVGGQDELIPDEIIEKWWGIYQYASDSSMGNYRRTVNVLRENAPPEMCRFAIYKPSARINLANVVEDVRLDVNTTATLVKAYTDFASGNKVSNVGHVYPQALASHFAALPWLKAAHDELAFFADNSLNRIYFSAGKNKGTIVAVASKLDTVFRLITRIYSAAAAAATAAAAAGSARSSNDDRFERMLVFSASSKTPNQQALRQKFVDSTRFLWFPMLEEEWAKGEYPIASDTVESDNTLFNESALLADEHARIFGSEKATNVADGVNKMLIILNGMNISDDVRQRLAGAIDGAKSAAK